MNSDLSLRRRYPTHKDYQMDYSAWRSVHNTHKRKQELLVCPFFSSKNGQRDLLLFLLKQVGRCPIFSSQLPDQPLEDPPRKVLVPVIQPQWTGSKGICSVASVSPVSACTLKPRWDRLHLMQTHNLCDCVLIGYTTYAWSYLPKSLRKIIEYHFFLSPHRKRFHYSIF